MNLTNHERKTLQAYQVFRKKPPTLSQLLLRMIPRFALIALIAVAAYYIFSASAGIFFAGAFFGALLRQTSILWQSTKIFPILIKVIDWDLVDELQDTPVEVSA